MGKIKNIEFSILKSFYDILHHSYNNPKSDKSLGIILPEFMKQVKSMAGNLSEALPHPLTFYYDLFATAHQMIFSRVHVTQKVKFSAMFNSDFNKFFAAVLEAHVEKHQDRKYAGKINLESQLFSSN